MPTTFDESVAQWSDDQTHPRRPVRDQTSILGGALWMIAISIGLFFLPAINGLIAGAVGGYKVGSIRRAILAALIPAVVLAAIVWTVFVAFDMVLLGFLAGLGVVVVVILADIGLLLGAIGGGWAGQQPRLPEARVHS